MTSKHDPLGAVFAKWWAGVAKPYKNKQTETVARAAWVVAWNDGRESARQQLKALADKWEKQAGAENLGYIQCADAASELRALLGGKP